MNKEYHFCYEEIVEIALWNIRSDIDTIIGYPCQKAATNLGGRNWEVWFTPEIPNKAGPWKLRGLPGLILKAETTDGEFLLTATSVSRTSSRTIAKDQTNTYREISKKEFFQGRNEAFNSINAIEVNPLEIVK